MNKPVKKLHHFLPRFYLRGFSSDSDGNIDQYILTEDSIVKAHVNNTGAEKFLYSIQTEESDRDDKIENMFAEFENSMAPAINKARKNPNSLSPDEKEWIVQFVTFQYLRTPKIIDRSGELLEGEMYKRVEEMANDPERLKRVFERSNTEGHSISELKEFMLKKQDAYRIKFSRNHLLGYILKLYGTVFPILFYLNWKILEAPKNHCFVTSDFPVSTLLRTPTHTEILSGAIGNPLAEIAIPLSSKLCLTANRNGLNFFKHVRVNARVVNYLNLRTIACANNFLYGKSFSADIIDIIKHCKLQKEKQGLDHTKKAVRAPLRTRTGL